MIKVANKEATLELEATGDFPNEGGQRCDNEEQSKNSSRKTKRYMVSGPLCLTGFIIVELILV